MASKAERIIPLLVAASAVAVIALFFHYYYDHDLTTTYGDGVARLNRARRMLDNPSGGFAVTPLGGVALPLMSLFMLATVWMEPLYRNGIAGSGISMTCFVLTCLFVFLTTRNLIDAMWHRKVAANLGALAAAEAVKHCETRSHDTFCMSTSSTTGWLIHATAGNRGGSGRRWRKRAGLAA